MLESELIAFKAFLRWARNNGGIPFTILLDTDVPATEFSVYLHSQRWEDARQVDMERDGESRIHFVVPFAVRTADGSEFDVRWDELATEPEA